QPDLLPLPQEEHGLHRLLGVSRHFVGGLGRRQVPETSHEAGVPTAGSAARSQMLFHLPAFRLPANPSDEVRPLRNVEVAHDALTLLRASPRAEKYSPAGKKRR